jgi:hypothetical protein
MRLARDAELRRNFVKKRLKRRKIQRGLDLTGEILSWRDIE